MNLKFWKKQTKTATPVAATLAAKSADGTIKVIQNLDELRYCSLPSPIEEAAVGRNYVRLIWACRVGDMRRLLPEGSAVTYAGTTFVVHSYTSAVCEYSLAYGGTGSLGSVLVTYKEWPIIEPTLVACYTDWMGVFHTRVFKYDEWDALATAKKNENERGDAQ